MSIGQELRQVADSCWNERTGQYHGGFFNGYNFSVREAMRQEVKEHGKQGKKRKIRREEAVKTVNATFDRARGVSTERLDKIASCVGPSGLMSNSSGEANELELFAQEVWDDLNSADTLARSKGRDPSTLISTLIDPQMIISLIMAIINAIRACKNPVPPAPSPV